MPMRKLFQNLNPQALRMQHNSTTYNTEICASGDTAELAKIRAFVEEHAKQFGFSEGDVMKIALAVDEACSNLVRHAYKHDKNQKFCVRVETKGDQFIVSILDNGPTFNPLNVASPDMKEYFKKLKPGGLGVQIMRMVMDELSYIPASQTQPQNALRLAKNLR